MFLRISLKTTSSLCKMKSKVTIEAHHTPSLYVLLRVIEIFNTVLCFSSGDNNPHTNFAYKTILVDYLKDLQLWIKSSISLTAVQNNIRITKTSLICVIISKISIWMLNGYSLQLVMASHHAMVLRDLLNVMLQNIVYKDPYMTKFWATNQCLIYV